MDIARLKIITDRAVKTTGTLIETWALLVCPNRRHLFVIPESATLGRL